MDPIIAGSLAFLMGLFAGRMTGALRHRPRSPICGCGHHLSFHDEQGCHDYYDDYGPRGQLIRCPCKQYVGFDPTFPR